MAESLEQLIQTEIATLKCSLCRNILSVPPVDLLSIDGKQLRCGRCENIPKESFGRDYAFEKIAKLLSFPCTYDGCPEVIPWDKVKDHEDVCNERTVMCPIDAHNNCPVPIKVNDLENHCLKNHSGFLSYESLTIKLAWTTFRILVFRKQIFFIFIDPSIYHFDIYVASLNNHTSLKYNLKLSSPHNDACVTFEQQDIVKYDERIHCLYCITNECSSAHHYYSKNNGKPKNVWGKTIQLDQFKSLLEINKEITLNLEIVAYDQYDHTTNHLRNSLQCPICMEYMIGHIFNCENGHVVCFTCRAKLDSCPSCQSKFGKSRNLPLENLAEVLMLSCSFAKKGCNFSGQVKKLFQHEKECAHK